MERKSTFVKSKCLPLINTHTHPLNTATCAYTHPVSHVGVFPPQNLNFCAQAWKKKMSISLFIVVLKEL